MAAVVLKVSPHGSTICIHAQFFFDQEESDGPHIKLLYSCVYRMYQINEYFYHAIYLNPDNPIAFAATSV